MSCPTCGASTRPVPGPGRELTVGTVAVSVERLPGFRCDAGHLSPSDDVDVARVLATCDELVPPAGGGRLRGDRCSGCRAALTMPVRRTVRSVPVAGASAIGVLTLHLDVPATRCPGCGRDQVPRRSQADLTAAVTQVLRATPPDPT